jgi:hypothetical protein
MVRMMTMRIKSYSEMIRYRTFEDRYEYLRMGGSIGVSTFGHSRYINQAFYTSRLWRSARDAAIIRDNGCDLGIPDRQIFDKIFVHHMNPITEEDVEMLSDFLLNPEFLICTSDNTHNAIHFGDSGLLQVLPVERFRNDTSPWK